MSAQLAQALKSAIAELDWLPTSDATQAIWERQQKTLEELRKALAAFEAAPQQEVWDAINKVQAKHLGLIKAAVDLIAQCHEQLETMPAPQCYGVPYGAVNALREALEAAPQQAQAPGWQLVPVEPTKEMVEAGNDSDYEGPANSLCYYDKEAFHKIWAAMLKAAPQQGGK